jgi:thiol-disulfide isomerase/thioredoxin
MPLSSAGRRKWLHSLAPLALFCALFYSSSTLATARFLEALNYDDLSSVVGPSPALVIVTVSWCDHCRQVVSEVRVLAKAAVAAGNAFTIALVDAEQEPAIAQKLHVDGYPSVLYLREGFSLRANDEPLEFEDYRWAEVLAEFVNNETGHQTLRVTPRKAYRDWRKRVPWNRGKVPEEERTRRRQKQEAMLAAQSKAMEEKDDGLASPEVVTAESFDELVLADPSVSVLVYFYMKTDPFHKNSWQTWREVSAAFNKEEDNVVIAGMDVAASDANQAVALAQANVSETPATVMFSRCNLEEIATRGAGCKRPQHCEGGACSTRQELITFLSDSVMERLGLNSGDIEKRSGERVGADGIDEGGGDGNSGEIEVGLKELPGGDEL